MEPSRNTLFRTDLNLLVPLHVLMEERSVTRAAERLFITQPAMSKTLNRLRELFGDPLFVRVGRKLAPTPKAQRLAAAIGPILDEINATVLQEPFSPEVARADVKILVSDTLAVAMTPPLFTEMRRRSPKIRLLLDGFSDSHLEQLPDGECDFSIFLDRDYGRDFQCFPLITWSLVCWMRAGHPLSDATAVSPADFGRYPFLLLTLPERRQLHDDDTTGRLGAFFRKHGLEELASLHVSSLLVARQIIKSSDAIMVGVAFSETEPVADGLVFKPFLEGPALTAPIALIQHRRTLASPLHSWMRGLIQGVWSNLERHSGCRPRFPPLEGQAAHEGSVHPPNRPDPSSGRRTR